MKNYLFKQVATCEMCGQVSDSHKILGLRLDKSQGLSPKNKTGIAVAIQKCSNCDLIYANPQPIPKSIQDHYGTPPEEYWKPSYFEWYPTYFKKQIDEAKSLINFQSGMRALDIGAGLGKGMLSMEAAGFETYGFEPSEPFYKRSLEKMNINKNRLKLGMIEEVDYENDYFDFISFGAVLEHLYNPAESIEKALKWTKPGGVIHIEVPSSDWLLPKFINFYYKIIGTSYVTNLSPMHNPFHLYEFGLKSFEELAEKLNFKIDKSYYDVCTVFYTPKVLKPLMKKIMESTNTGMQLTVYLKKNG